VNPALLFLVRRSFVNAVKSKFLRLKNPRYLVPTIVGIAYFVLVFGPFRDGSRGRDWTPPAASGPSPFMEWGFTAAVLVFAAAAWVFPARGTPLGFSESEVALLFPSPLSRKELVRYKLLDMQKYLVVTPIFFAVFNIDRLGLLRSIFLLVGTWLALTVMTLHGIGAKMTRLSLAEHGGSGLRRQLLPLLLVAGYATFVVLQAPALPDFGSLDKPMEAAAAWLRALGESPAGKALYPFRILVLPAMATGVDQFLVRTAILGGMAFALYFWILRNDVAFEEAAAAHAGLMAARVEAARKGRFATATPGKPPRKNPWRLGLDGSPEVAFAWKSVTEILRAFSPRLVLFMVVALGVALPFALKAGGSPQERTRATVSVLMAVGAGLLVLGGSSFLGVNLRQDLERVEVLKTLPLSGPRLVRSSVAGSVLPIGVVQAFLLLGAAALFPATSKAPGFTAGWRVAVAFAGIVGLPCLAALSASVDAGLALYFPGWFKPGQTQQMGGMEGMGYGIVSTLGKVFVLGLAMLVPGTIGVLSGVVGVNFAGPLFGPAVVMAGALTGAAVVLVEVWVLSGILGRRFERLDPAEEGMIS
jgi:ABC-2 type transport system permease protein